MRWPGRGGEELAKKKGQARVTASREEWESTTAVFRWGKVGEKTTSVTVALNRFVSQHTSKLCN